MKKMVIVLDSNNLDSKLQAILTKLDQRIVEHEKKITKLMMENNNLKRIINDSTKSVRTLKGRLQNAEMAINTISRKP